MNFKSILKVLIKNRWSLIINFELLFFIKHIFRILQIKKSEWEIDKKISKVPVPV